MLDDHQRGAAPFTADGDALQHPQGDEEDGRPDTDGVVGGQQPDEEAGTAHQTHGQQQHGLTAEPVAEVPEDDAAEGTGDVSGGEGAESGDRADGRVGAREEQLAEDERGDRSVDEEVVELDGRTEQPGERDATQLPCTQGLFGLFGRVGEGDGDMRVSLELRGERGRNEGGTPRR